MLNRQYDISTCKIWEANARLPRLDERPNSNDTFIISPTLKSVLPYTDILSTFCLNTCILDNCLGNVVDIVQIHSHCVLYLYRHNHFLLFHKSDNAFGFSDSY